MTDQEAMKIISDKVDMAKKLLQEAKDIAEEQDIGFHAEVDFNNNTEVYHSTDWNSSSAYC